MNNSNYTNYANGANGKSGERRTKGCLALAPGGEKLIAAMSVIGWLTFIIKFAVV